VIASPDSDELERVLRQVYELHADYVLKNPFYEMDMPIKCELFDVNIAQLIKSVRQ
jgi:hypothetical protein